MQTSRLPQIVALVCLAVLFLPLPFTRTHAEEVSVSAADSLALTQEKLADKYQRLEMLMLKMAEVDAAENPQRSALLKKAIAQSKGKFIKRNMDGLVKVLQQERYRNAIAGQSGVRNDLRLLLELLENENRTDRIKDEQDRVRKYIRELKRIIRQQKSVQGRTESGEETNRLAEAQKQIADRAEKLAKEIDENESPPDDQGDGESDSTETVDRGSEGSESADSKATGDSDNDDDSSSGDQKSPDDDAAKDSDSETEPKKEQSEPDGDSAENDGNQDPKKGQDGSSSKEGSDGKPSEQEQLDSNDGSEQSSDGKPSNDSPSSKGEPSNGDQQEQPSDSNAESQAQPQPKQNDDFPGEKRIEDAQERMKQATKKLEQAERDGAVEEQEEARRLLELAQAELEEILRQLREEEVERTLTQLEARFRKMLAMQIAVFDDTTRLAKIPQAKRNKSFDIESNKVSIAERKIVAEADRAILLLVEEGSSVAFPEATEQIRGDMEQIAQLLSEAKVTPLTIGLEEEVIASLEEMIAALQQAQKDAEERKQQQQQQPPQNQQAGQQDQPLVNAIEELKMIRALQMRVNKRTDLYAKAIADADDLVGQAKDPEVIESLEELAKREARIQKIMTDIVSGKTR